MNTSPQRRQTRKSSQTDPDAYVRLLSELTDDTENVPASTSSLILALLYSGCSWLCRLKGVFPLPLQTYSRQLYVLRMAGKMLLRCARAARVLPTVFMATIFGFLAAVSFTWIWWYARRRCIWIVYRLVIPFILNSVIALIPTSIPAMDDADWSRSVLTATAIFAQNKRVPGEGSDAPEDMAAWWRVALWSWRHLNWRAASGTCSLVMQRGGQNSVRNWTRERTLTRVMSPPPITVQHPTSATFGREVLWRQTFHIDKQSASGRYHRRVGALARDVDTGSSSNYPQRQANVLGHVLHRQNVYLCRNLSANRTSIELTSSTLTYIILPLLSSVVLRLFTTLNCPWNTGTDALFAAGIKTYVKPCKPQYSTPAFVTVTAPVTMDESSQGSTASLESRLESRMESGQDSSDQSPPGREVRSKESPDISSNRKQSLSVDGFCDNRGREAQVPEGGRAHDAELKSDLVPVTMTQGSTVAALADCRSQTDEQEGEALDSMASCPDIVDGARDNFGEQPAFQAPSTPIGPTMRAQPTGQQPVQQTLSHQTELQAHAQHPSAQTGANNHQLRSPISISFASSDTTHRILRRRRRRGRGDAGKPEGSRCCEAGAAHAVYPSSQRPGRLTPGKQATRAERVNGVADAGSEWVEEEKRRK
ncbi:hypothetical protein NQ176_g2194 [Zarea fungicola]|uniref:Uncharacterized protein n=1 Tax=Zarea fungicola TaxID=93591 RepID=A0ACC1NRY3_9HYPO|nr:hypothetical protein NQ176_g2194 [Lecanicillium fungicola]